MYMKLYDLDKAKYCLIEFNTFVGELPKGVVIGEVVDEYASEKLIEDKKELLEKGYFDFSATNAVKIHNIKAVLSEYEKLKKDVTFYKKESDRLLRQLNMQTEELDKCLEEKEKIERELEMLKIKCEGIIEEREQYLKELINCKTSKQILEEKLQTKIIDYSAKDDVEVLKGVINLILDGKTNEALKVLLEFV